MCKLLFTKSVLCGLFLTAFSCIQASPVAPNEVSGLQFWFAPDENVLETESAFEWNDLATTGPFPAIQPTPDNQPQWKIQESGVPILQFDGRNDYMHLEAIDLNLKNSLTLFIAFTLSDFSKDMALLDTKNVNSAQPGFYLANRKANEAQAQGDRIQFGVKDENFSLQPQSLEWSAIPDVSPGDLMIMSVRLEADGLITMQVGEVIVADRPLKEVTDISGEDSLHIGSNSRKQWFLDGGISAIALYNRALSDNEIKSVFEYFQTTYAP